MESSAPRSMQQTPPSEENPVAASNSMSTIEEALDSVSLSEPSSPELDATAVEKPPNPTVEMLLSEFADIFNEQMLLLCDRLGGLRSHESRQLYRPMPPCLYGHETLWLCEEADKYWKYCRYLGRWSIHETAGLLEGALFRIAPLLTPSPQSQNDSSVKDWPTIAAPDALRIPGWGYSLGDNITTIVEYFNELSKCVSQKPDDGRSEASFSSAKEEVVKALDEFKRAIGFMNKNGGPPPKPIPGPHSHRIYQGLVDGTIARLDEGFTGPARNPGEGTIAYAIRLGAPQDKQWEAQGYDFEWESARYASYINDVIRGFTLEMAKNDRLDVDSWKLFCELPKDLRGDDVERVDILLEDPLKLWFTVYRHRHQGELIVPI